MFKCPFPAFVYAVLWFFSLSYPLSCFASLSPKVIHLIEVSSIQKNQLMVSWLPTTDDKTPSENLLYSVYVSEKADFQPNKNILKAKKIGASSAIIRGLQPDKAYFVLVTATDGDGNVSYSNLLTGKTVSFDYKLQPSFSQRVLSAHTAKRAKQAEQVISNPLNYTKHGSLNEVFSDVAFNTTVQLQDLPSTDNSVSQRMRKRKATNNQIDDSISWQETGLTLSRKFEPVSTSSTGLHAAKQRIDITNSGQTQVNTGDYGRITAPAYASAQPATLFSLNVPIAAVHDKPNLLGGYTHIEVCKAKWSISHKNSTLNDLLVSNKPTTTFNRTKVNTDFYNRGDWSLKWIPTEQNVALSGVPYIVSVDVYYDAVGDNCNGDNFTGTWEEVLTVNIPVYVAKGTPDATATDKLVNFEGSFNVANKVSYDIKPALIIGATISSGYIQTADLTAQADLSFTNKLTITSTGSATLVPIEKVIVPERKFIKVFNAGGVPIVVSGTFKINAKLEGSVNGKVQLEKLLQLNFPDTSFGLTYRRDRTVKWQVTKNFAPSYKFTIGGTADAGANLTLTLIPDLQINFYDAASARMLVEPYLYAQAGLQGQLKYEDINGEPLTDLDYWFTDLQAGAGLDMRLYAGLHIFDYNLASYPANVEIWQTNLFKKVTVFQKTPLAKLPTLDVNIAEYPEGSLLTDSRAMRVMPLREDYTASVLNRTFKVIQFAGWDAPKVITNKTGAEIKPLDAEGMYWFTYQKPGTYTIRLAGHSNLGWFVRQIAEQTIVLTDSDADGMVDQWETLFNVTDPAADNDGDGRSNLLEFRQGGFPNEKELDSDNDGMPDYWEARYGLESLNATDATLDKDKDGRSNLNEFKLASDPTVVNVPQTAVTGKLNDTGITTCSDSTQNNLPCPVAGFPGQDAQFGRDKTNNNNADGHAGFSFTKISATGAALAASATAWNCVKDNVTGLMWENKTDDGGLHDKDNAYSWYEPDTTKNGGFAGYQNYGSCVGSACDTKAFVNAVNVAGWCGFKDWRLPSKEELYSIVDYSRYNPAIDVAYFPNTVSSWAWSSSPYASNSNSAWIVSFGNGNGGYGYKDGSYSVRLVRGGQ